MKRRDWLLAVVAAADEDGLTPVQLQKSLFLIGKTLTAKHGKAGRFYHFEPYDYGPFCSDIYQDATALQLDNLLRVDYSCGSSYRRYIVTEDGRQASAGFMGGLAENVRDYLIRLVVWIKSQSFKELVMAIYRSHPDMKVNSVFREHE